MEGGEWVRRGEKWKGEREGNDTGEEQGTAKG